MKLKLSTALAIVICNFICYTNSAQDHMNASPSPDASSLVRHVQSMNYYLGAANIQIPLHTLSFSGIEVPIALSYNTSGIKVDDYASSVGLGWNMSAGGKIVRVVRGFPDESENGYCNGWPYKDGIGVYKHAFKSTKGSDYRSYYSFDGEPDLFYFEIPGATGMFVFDHDGNAITIPYQHISIKWVDKTYFIITDHSGTQYTFGSNKNTREVTQTTYHNDNLKADKQTISYSSSWFLENIQTITYNKIEFEYQQGADVTYEDIITHYTFRSYRSGDNWKNGSGNATTRPRNTTSIIYAPKYLLSIKSEVEEIAFEVTLRSDLANAMKYSSINIYDKLHTSTLRKKLTLGYSFFSDNRLQLSRVQELFGSEMKTLCMFEYNNAYYHTRDTYSVDYWGYYNGKPNKDLRLGFIFRYNNTGARDNFPNNSPTPKWVDNYSGIGGSAYLPSRHLNGTYRSSGTRAGSEHPYQREGGVIPSNIPHEDKYYMRPYICPHCTEDYTYPHSTTFPGADRSPDLFCAQTNILKKIKYPSGLETEYVYELNEMRTFKAQPTNKKVGGLRVKEVVTKNGDDISKVKYLYRKDLYSNESSGVAIQDVCPEFFYITDFRHEIAWPNQQGESYRYFRISSKPFYGMYDQMGNHIAYSTIIEIQPNGSKTIRQFTTPYDLGCYDLGPRLVRKVDGNISVWAPSTTDYHLLKPATPRFWLRGLLKSEESYDSFNNLISRKVNIYKTGNIKKTIESYIVDLEQVFKSIHEEIIITNWESTPLYLDSVIVEKGPYNLYAETTYQYDTTYLVPKRIVERSDNGDSLVTETLYTFNHWEIAGMNQLGIVVPTETIKYKNDKIISGKLDSYDYISISTPNGIRLIPALNGQYQLRLKEPISSIRWSNMSNGQWAYIRDDNYELVNSSDYYDKRGNQTSSVTSGGIRKSVILGHKNSLVISEITNAIYYDGFPYSDGNNRHNQVFHTSFEDNADSRVVTTEKAKTGNKVYNGSFGVNVSNFKPGIYTLSYWQSNNGGSVWTKVENKNVNISNFTQTVYAGTSAGILIDEIRLLPADARITTYTYKPGFGKMSEMDHNGRVMYWEYDERGRLLRVLDNDRNPVKGYEYNFKMN